MPMLLTVLPKLIAAFFYYTNFLNGDWVLNVLCSDTDYSFNIFEIIPLTYVIANFDRVRPLFLFCKKRNKVSADVTNMSTQQPVP
ncbi:unnamed protein product [Caenorhabditis angaria]|uniref:Uncharacterized protein n=1 Tax=Caenorhabditis angaria TaxID=860376 RepID=A0A9P1IDT0_9PELO|nr:unnamed protein product [Caenorhabditis angaria]